MFDANTMRAELPYSRNVEGGDPFLSVRDLQDAFEMAQQDVSAQSKESTPSVKSVQGRAGEAWANVGQQYGSPDLFSSLGWVNLVGQAADEFIPWSWYPYRRDQQLRVFARSETILAGGIFNMRSRVEALPYRVKGTIKAKEIYGTMLARSDLGGGAAQLFGKTMYDMVTQDNGFFWEMVGAGNPLGPIVGPVVQLNHMDANRCWRTWDPEYPVIYYNPYDASFHKMHKTRIVIGSDNTMPDEIARGIGFCATSRALRAAQIMRDIAVFKHEKISGNFTRAMLILKGITTKQVSRAKQVADIETESDGLTYFRKIPILSTMREDADYRMIDFASLPDGFDTEKDTTLYVYCLALAFGVDAREFWPATSSGATKGDAKTQHMKAQGKGIGYYISKIRHAINYFVLNGTGAEFESEYMDLEQQLQDAQIAQVEIQNIGLMQMQGDITKQEGRAILISKGIINPNQISNIDQGIDALDDVLPTEEDMKIDIPVDISKELDKESPKAPPPTDPMQIQQHPSSANTSAINPVRQPPQSIADTKEINYKDYKITDKDIVAAIKSLEELGIKVGHK